MSLAYVDTKDLSRLARDLAKASPEAWAACRTSMRMAVAPIAEEARVRAAFSSRIEYTIKVRTGRGNVKIVAGGEAAPNAAAIENRGKGHVRHPVYGNRDVWTEKNSPPAYLEPAYEGGKDKALDEIEEAVVATVERALGVR
jgi:hypothetical protein